MAPEPIFHIARSADWAAARTAGAYRVSTRDRTLAEEGFIHCSAGHQVAGVARAFYAGAEDLVLLEIDPGLVGVPIRWEAAVAGGEEYPHVYGPLPVAAVVSARPFDPNRPDPPGA